MTIIVARKAVELGVSIHTPTKGVTSDTSLISISWISFNPHTHEGCDRIDALILDVVLVSIHTPTKGVTFKPLEGIKLLVVSIHTPTKGVTYLPTVANT